jgi:hypothetical protein
MIFDAWGQGNSLDAIEKKLNNEGYTTKKGNWSYAQTIKNIINYNNGLKKAA